MPTNNKYEGLDIKSLLFLANTELSVSYNEQLAVWNEIFNQYFNNGKTFNLYAEMNKVENKNKYLFFSIVMEYELKDSLTTIPLEHVKDFIILIVQFIDFIDKTVMNNPDVRVEWTIHEFYGIKDMLDKVQHANIVDVTLRQKINIFIDKINAARQEEQAKSKGRDLPIASKMQADLMAEQLKHLSIPASKINKQDLINILQSIEKYYPEDRKKLCTRMAKHFNYDFRHHFPAIAFLYYLKNPDSNVDMNALTHKITNINLPEHLKFMDVQYFQNWFSTLPGYTQEFFDTWIINNFERYYKNPHCNVAMEKVYNSIAPTIAENNGKTLSEILKAPPVSVYLYNDIKWGDPDTNKYEILWNDTSFKIINHSSNFQFPIITIPHLFNGKFDFIISASRTIGESRYVVAEGYDTELALKFANFYSSIIIDDEGIEMAKKFMEKESSFNNLLLSSLCQMIQQKAIESTFTSNEIKLLFKTHYFDFFDKLNHFLHGSGQFSKHNDYILKYFSEILNLYDFSNPEDLKLFFQIKLELERLLNGSEYKEINELYSKLKKYFPNEIYILDSFFDSTSQESKKASNPYVALIEESKSATHKDEVSIRVEYHDKIVSRDIAKKYMIIKYFFNKY